MNEKALNYLALARKGGLIQLGEEPVGAAARAQHARLVLVASDASDHTWRRAKSFVAGTQQLCMKVPFDKDRMGQAVGRTSLAIAAFTDPAIALAFVKALEAPQQHAELIEKLNVRSQRQQQRRKEAKSHAKNVRMGRVRRKTEEKNH